MGGASWPMGQPRSPPLGAHEPAGGSAQGPVSDPAPATLGPVASSSVATAAAVRVACLRRAAEPNAATFSPDLPPPDPSTPYETASPMCILLCKSPV